MEDKDQMQQGFIWAPYVMVPNRGPVQRVVDNIMLKLLGWFSIRLRDKYVQHMTSRPSKVVGFNPSEKLKSRYKDKKINSSLYTTVYVSDKQS